MKSIFSMRFVPLAMAAILIGSYAAIIFGFPLLLSRFINFKIEMPLPTMLAINFSKFLASPLGLASCGILVFAVAFALARGDKFAWGVGLLLSFIFGEAQLCLILPIMAAANSIGAFNIAHPEAQILMILAIALVPPLFFLALRRAFDKAQPRRNQTLSA